MLRANISLFLSAYLHLIMGILTNGANNLKIEKSEKFAIVKSHTFIPTPIYVFLFKFIVERYK